MRVISGGCSTKWCLPSTSSVILGNRCSPMRLRAFAAICSRWSLALASARLRSSLRRSRGSTRLQEGSSRRIRACALGRTAQVAATSLKHRSDMPLTRPATTKLAASRFRSHSHGARSVSSKSLISKIRLRSGVAKSPKLRRWQSPQACTAMPVVGVLGEVVRHERRRSTQERERTAQHPSVANGNELRKPATVGFFDDLDRIASGLRCRP